MHFFGRTCLVLVATLAFSIDASSQEPGLNQWGAWAGYAPSVAHLIGTAPDRQLAEFGLRWARTMKRWDDVEVKWTIDVLPAEVAIQPTSSQFVFQSTSGQYLLVESGRRGVYGGGINPLGFRFNFFTRHRIQLFAGSTAGFVASTIPVPEDVPGATRFNFTFDFGQAGVEFFNASRNRSLMLGYKVQHISNAYRSDVNPGVDFNVIFFGYSFSR